MNMIKKCTQATVATVLSASLWLPCASALSTAKVTASALYLRATPGGQVIMTLPHDTIVTIQDDSDKWYKVAVNGKEGYVSSEYLEIVANGDTSTNTAPTPDDKIDPETGTTTAAPSTVQRVSVTEPEEADPETIEAVSGNLGQARVASSSGLNLREEPNQSSRVLTSIPNNTILSPQGTKDNWYQVSYRGLTGYVHPDYIEFDVVLTSNDELDGQLGDAAITSSDFMQISELRQNLLDYAAEFLGVPYVYGGSTPDGFDCSGFTSYVYKALVGPIPRIAQSQFDAAEYVSREDLIPGDLVFFGSSAYSVSHVGIYVGDGQFIHAPHTGDVVKYEYLDNYYSNRFQGGGRFIFDEEDNVRSVYEDDESDESTSDESDPEAPVDDVSTNDDTNDDTSNNHNGDPEWD